MTTQPDPNTGSTQFFLKTYQESPDIFLHSIRKLLDRTITLNADRIQNDAEYEVVVSWELKKVKQ